MIFNYYYNYFVECFWWTLGLIPQRIWWRIECLWDVYDGDYTIYDKDYNVHNGEYNAYDEDYNVYDKD